MINLNQLLLSLPFFPFPRLPRFSCLPYLPRLNQEDDLQEFRNFVIMHGIME